MIENRQDEEAPREEFVRVAGVGDLVEGRGKLVHLDGHKVALYRKRGRYYAFGDTCPHMGAALSEGYLHQDHSIVCHWHGWRFDARTGACLKQGKWWASIPVYEVRVDGDDILLRRPPGEPPAPPDEEEPWMNWEPPAAPAKSET